MRQKTENTSLAIRSRVPLRISFGGGGTDVSPYCEEYGGAVINATINRYATVTLIPQEGEKACISSIDYDSTIDFTIDQFLAYDGHLDLIKGVINHMKNHFSLPSGFRLSIQNDAPPGSGLGSSSAVCVALVGVFKHWLNLSLSPYEIAQTAFHIEREELSIRGGRQDQFAAAFGGLNFMEFEDGTVVNPLRLRPEILYELHHSLILAYIGGSHDSSKILKQQIEDMALKKEQTLSSLHRLKKLAYEMKNTLVIGKLGRFGCLLDEAWNTKQMVTDGISNPYIEKIYLTARRAGALGGKISGAGGGGFMFFFADLDRKYEVINALTKEGLQIMNYSFSSEGLHSWEVRA